MLSLGAPKLSGGEDGIKSGKQNYTPSIKIGFPICMYLGLYGYFQSLQTWQSGKYFSALFLLGTRVENMIGRGTLVVGTGTLLLCETSPVDHAPVKLTCSLVVAVNPAISLANCMLKEISSSKFSHGDAEGSRQRGCYSLNINFSHVLEAWTTHLCSRRHFGRLAQDSKLSSD